MVPIDTPNGNFRVWTKRVGTNPDLKVLLLHGGPGSSDELYESFDGGSEIEVSRHQHCLLHVSPGGVRHHFDGNQNVHLFLFAPLPSL